MTALALAATAALTAFVPPAVGQQVAGYSFFGLDAQPVDAETNADRSALPGIFWRQPDFFEQLSGINWEHPQAAAGLAALGRDEDSVELIAVVGPELTVEQLEAGDYSKVESVFVDVGGIARVGETETHFRGNVGATNFVRIA